MARPRNWPHPLPYLTSPSHSNLLALSQHAILTTKQPSVTEINANLTVSPCPLVMIMPITSEGHPANGQFGLFASRHLEPGTFVLPYFGVVHPDSTAESDYDIWLDRDAEIAVDAEKAGNEARFVNDYRGIGRRPNAEFKEIWSHRHRERCMAVFVLPRGKRSKGKAGISKGEEILVSYGKGFWNHRMQEVGVIDSQASES